MQKRKLRKRESGKAETKASASRLGCHRAADGHVKELASAGKKITVATGGRSRGNPTWRGRVTGHFPSVGLRRKKTTANATHATSLALLGWRVKGA